MAEKITWTAGRRKLKDLKPWERNPRQITKEQARRLAESFDEFGQVETIAISPTDDVYNGHQRLAVLMEKHGGDYEVEVRISSRALTEKEREKLTVYLHKGAAGEWNFDALANGFEVDELIEWGFRPEELGITDDEQAEDETYSRKIEAPIYTPKGDKPKISALYDDTRANELIREIDASDLPEDEKEFLRVAARRHTVINYKRVAEYYAHSEKPVQTLMENSALIIIDFNRAIELGYVKLSEEIAKQYGIEYGDK